MDAMDAAEQEAFFSELDRAGYRVEERYPESWGVITWMCQTCDEVLTHCDTDIDLSKGAVIDREACYSVRDFVRKHVTEHLLENASLHVLLLHEPVLAQS